MLARVREQYRGMNDDASYIRRALGLAGNLAPWGVLALIAAVAALTGSPVASLILLALIAGCVWLRVNLRRWERREQRLAAVKPSDELTVLWVKLAPGITDADERFAKGHAKAASVIGPHGRFLDHVHKRKPSDTSASVDCGVVCPHDKVRSIETCYTSFFAGEISFFEDADFPLDGLYAGYLAGHRPDPSRAWALAHLRRCHLA